MEVDPDDPLEDFVGTTNEVSGHVAFDPARPDRGVRGEFIVPVRKFGIKGFEGVVGSKVSEKIDVKVSVMGTTKAPTAGNPCNPCAQK